MTPVLAMAPAVPLTERVALVAIGFILAIALGRARGRKIVGLLRPSICLGVAVAVGAFLPIDGRGVFAFFAGALGGSGVYARSVRIVPTYPSRSWALVIACIIGGPVMGALIAASVTSSGEPTGPFPHMTAFVVIGVISGLVASVIVGLVAMLSDGRAEPSDGAESR